MTPNPVPPLVASAGAAMLVLSAGALLTWRPGRTRGRLRGLALTAAPARQGRAIRPGRFLGPVVGLVVALLVSGWPGPVVGVVVGVLVDRAVRRWEPRAVRAARLRAESDLPFALDLTAAALRSGAPPDRCVLAVGDALGGPLGHRFGEVGRALALGSTPAVAWDALRDVGGAERFAAAVVRGSQSGAALAGALARLADDLRSARLAALEARGHRAAVLVVLPLGLCFLPAFVTGGLVPVVISMLGTVLP
ncbi:MAG: type II secretion system F family protein [Actinocatenispora sp.]